MRRISHIVLSVLLLAACACTKDAGAVSVPCEMRFKAVSGSAETKAAVVDTDTLQARGFLVYANVREPEESSSTPLMYAQHIGYTAGKWSYTPVKYWPTTAGATVDFYPAYTDSSENVKILYDWYNRPQTTFYVNDIVSKQTDMLWAAPVLGAQRENYFSTPVTFTFKHSLTAFFFRIQLGSEPAAGTSVKVNSVTLTGFFAPKAYVIPYETTCEKAYSLQGDWQERSYTISASGDSEISDGAAAGLQDTVAVNLTGTKGYIMVLPFNYQEYTVSLCYDVRRGAQTTSHNVGYTETGVDLQQGKICHTLLKLKLDDLGCGQIEHTATLQDWTDIIVGNETLVIQ